MKTVRKSPLFALLFIITVILTFVACNGEKKGEEKPEAEAEEIAEPTQIIPVKYAKTTYNNYSVHRVPLIQKYEDSGIRDRYDNKMQQGDQKQEEMEKKQAAMQKDSFDVARYGYYSLDSLKQYIAYIEQEATRAKVDVNSLRIYFSNYPKEEKFEGRKVLHPKQNSFFFVPTTERGERDYAFFIRGSGDDWHPVLLSDQLEEIDDPGMGSIYEPGDRSHASFIPTKINSAPATVQGDKSLFSNEVGMVPPPHQ